MKVKMNKEDWENPQKVGEGIDETFLENINAEMQNKAELLQVSSFLVANKNLRRAYEEFTGLYNDISNFYNDVSKIIDIKPEIRSLLEEIEKQYIDLQKLFFLNDFSKNKIPFENDSTKIIYPDSYHILNSELTYNFFNKKDFSLNDFLNLINNPFSYTINNEPCIAVVEFNSEEDKAFFENNKAFIGCIIRTISGFFYKEEKRLLEKNCTIFQDNERPKILLTQLWKYIANDKKARIDRTQKRKDYLKECIAVLKRTKFITYTVIDKNAKGDNQYAEFNQQELLPLEPYLSMNAKGDITEGYKLNRVPLLDHLGIEENHYLNFDFKDDVNIPLVTINHITLFYGLCNFLGIQNQKKSSYVSLSLDRIYKENLNNYEKDIKRPARLYNELEYVLDRLVAIKKINRYKKRKSKENPNADIIDFFFFDEKTTSEIKQQKDDEKAHKELIDALSKEVAKNQRKRKKS